MQAIYLSSYGEAPELRDAPDPPAPGPSQLLVRVRAASVNPVDWKQASGKIWYYMAAKFPFVPGFDLAGEVVASGPGCEAFPVATRVHTRLHGKKGGAYGTLAIAGLNVANPMPAGMSFEQAAAIPLAGMTALQGLHNIAGLPMEGAKARVLVVGASGGVGHLAVQIAVAMGAHTTGVCSGRNVAFVRGLGAHEVVDYTQPNPYANRAPYDVVMDCVGSDPAAFTPLLTPKGTFASCMPGAAVIGWSALNFARQRSVKPVMLRSSAADLGTLDRLFEAGKLAPAIDSTFSLADTAKAWDRSQSGRAVGKIVISMP